VVVNMFSTMNIEGALLDKPLINVCFEGGGRPDRGGAKARFDIFSDAIEDHNQRIVDSGAAAMAYSADALLDHLRLYLANPAKDQAARQRVALDEGGPNRGRAGRSIADALLADFRPAV
jgi:hypothetical protein